MDVGRLWNICHCMLEARTLGSIWLQWCNLWSVCERLGFWVIVYVIVYFSFRLCRRLSLCGCLIFMPLYRHYVHHYWFMKRFWQQALWMVFMKWRHELKVKQDMPIEWTKYEVWNIRQKTVGRFCHYTLCTAFMVQVQESPAPLYLLKWQKLFIMYNSPHLTSLRSSFIITSLIFHLTVSHPLASLERSLHCVHVVMTETSLACLSSYHHGLRLYRDANEPSVVSKTIWVKFSRLFPFS